MTDRDATRYADDHRVPHLQRRRATGPIEADSSLSEGMMISQISTFIHPSFALAAAGLAAVPILIHLLNRRRYRRQPWAAMDFLLTAGKLRHNRLRLEQWLLLLMRMALMALICLAIARPVFPAMPLASLGQSRSHHVLLVDDSFSMGARYASRTTTEPGARPTTRFERAIQLVIDWVDRLPAGDAVSLVTMGGPARTVIQHAAYDRRVVRDQLQNLQRTHRTSDWQGSLAAAGRILDESEFLPSQRILYIVSDWQSSTIKAEHSPPPADPGEANAPGGQMLADGIERLAAKASIVLIDTADKENLGSSDVANLAITELSISSVAGAGVHLGSARLPASVNVTLGNYSPDALHDAHVELSVNGQWVRRFGLAPIAPFETAHRSTSIPIQTSGSHVVAASIASDGEILTDALPDDGIRYLSTQALDHIPVLVVDGERPEAGSTSRASGSEYVSIALAPRTQKSSLTTFLPRTIPEARFSSEPLATIRVVVLCNVSQLEAVDWTRIREWVTGGGGLLIFGGERVSADDYNHWAVDLLPAPLAGVTEISKDVEFVRFATPDATGIIHSALADFSAENVAAQSGLFLARISKYLSIDQASTDQTSTDQVPTDQASIGPNDAGPEIVLQYTNGQPAILARRVGRGRVILVTTSADMSWTNLPAKGDFVPLLVNLMSYLMGEGGTNRTVLVGEFIEEPLSARETQFAVNVTGPGGESNNAGDANNAGAALDSGLRRSDTAFEIVTTDNQPILRSELLEQPGVYRATVGSRSFAFVVNASPSESDLRPIGRAWIDEHVECPFDYFGADEFEKRIEQRHAVSELGGRLLLAVFILLVLETTFSRVMGAFR